MMGVVRAILGAIILFLDRIFSPKPLVRAPEQQQAVDLETRQLALYQFAACPFCVKVRRHFKRQGLNIELRDANSNATFKQELLSQGGELQVPCLRIANADGSARWLYESSDIIAYVDQRFSL